MEEEQDSSFETACFVFVKALSSHLKKGNEEWTQIPSVLYVISHLPCKEGKKKDFPEQKG